MTRNLGPELEARPQDQGAAELLQRIHALLDEEVGAYLKVVRRSAKPLAEKVLNDAVWGTIRLYPWEVGILDSPVVQRLRGLRQLGVIHWVYPGAGHSRFEHSIGAVHQVQALIDGLDRTSGMAFEGFIPDADTKLLRLTAMLHDCGHIAFSHVGERHVGTRPDVRALQKWIGKEHGVDPPSPSETFAAVIVRSPAFVRLLTEPRIAADFIASPAVAARQIAGLILGAPGVLERAFLGDLISGPYDADKLDYMVRDSHMAGLPPAVDVRRITEKLQCIAAGGEYGGSAAALEALDRHRVKAGETGHVLALPRAGTSVLRELARSRASLFEKMYFHHKVRALEAVAVRALAEREEREGASRPLWWLEDGDETIIAASVGEWSLRWRRLPKRAAFIAPPARNGSQGVADGTENFWSLLHLPKERKKVAEDIVAETTRLTAALGRPLRATPELDFPDWRRGQFDDRALVGDVAEELASPRPQETGGLSKSAETYAREGGFVYSSPEDVEITHLAVLGVLHDRGIKRTSEMLDRTNVDRDDLAKVEAMLRDKGLLSFDPLAAPTRSNPRRNRGMETLIRSAASRIQVLGGRFGQFQKLGGGSVGPVDVARFLRQFETVDRARAMLRVLESIDVRGRGPLVKALDHVLSASRVEGRPVQVICPLGASGDSSAWSSYFVGDLGDDGVEVMPLELALDAGFRRILLWDDFCGQSGHGCTTLWQWAGERVAEPPERLRLKEKLATKLSDTRWSEFQNAEVQVGFAAGRPAGIADMRAYLESTELRAIHVRDPVDPVPDHDGFLDDNTADTTVSDPAMRAELRQFLTEKAREVASEEKWNNAEDRLLGYGNYQHRVVFFYNVPTVTLTSLWAGTGGWVPLFTRRKKAKPKS